MLTIEEQKELEQLKKDKAVKAAVASYAKKYPTDPDKKRLYQYRWLKRKGEKILRGEI